jgi:DNA polymerase III subunit beta
MAATKHCPNSSHSTQQIITGVVFMKFIISTQEFNYLISKCLNVVSQKMTIPILSNILIEAINDELILTATDLTVGIRCFTEAKILEEGATTIPAKRLAQLIKELTSINLEITANANEITEIVSDSSKFKLHGMNKSEFPSLPTVNEAVRFNIKQADLKNMLFRTAFAVSREDTRYVLTGVFMHIEKKHATFVGTDGKRLARAHIDVNVDPELNLSYIIPLKAVEEIQKNLTEEKEAVIYLMNDKIAVEASNTVIITKLLSGEYPDINRIIPESSDIVVTLHREELMRLLRQVSLFTIDANHSVRFTLQDGELYLMANTSEIGEGKVSMPANYHGQKLEIAFNPNFFLDILRHSKEEVITLGLTDSYNPGIITDGQVSAPSLVAASSPIFVLMPMRLNEE